MTIFSRRDVIETMKLVGATNNFVRAPFMIEGTLGGLCAASLAITFIAACVYLVNNYLQTFITYRLLVSYRFYLGLVILGGVMGLIGSLRAVRKFL
jgi:cell division transport system permease protein